MRLTRQEIVLIACILAALLVGVGVKYYREQVRLHAGAPTAAVPKP